MQLSGLFRIAIGGPAMNFAVEDILDRFTIWLEDLHRHRAYLKMVALRAVLDLILRLAVDDDFTQRCIVQRSSEVIDRTCIIVATQ